MRYIFTAWIIIGLFLFKAYFLKPQKHQSWNKFISELNSGKQDVYVDYPIDIPVNAIIYIPNGTTVTIDPTINQDGKA